MNLKEYASYDAVGLAELVRNKDITAQELSALAREAIAAANPILNFLAHDIPVAEEGPLLDESTCGALYGVPFLMKEGGAAIKGQPWNMGSRLGVGRIATEDDELTTRFRKAGVTLVGQSTAPEQGNATTTESVLHGPTRNPWDTDAMPGGSSGGGAAAVAAGVTPLAHATDGAGSIRVPAACCGVVGLKPTRSRTPSPQEIVFLPYVNHVVSRSVRDTAVMLDCIQGSVVGDIYTPPPPARPYLEEVSIAPRPLKIGFTTQSPSGAPVHPDCVNGVLASAKMCEEMGHGIEEVTLPYDWEPFMEAFLDLWSYRYPYSMEILEKATGLRCGPDTRETGSMAMLAHAQQLTMLDFTRNLDGLAAICRKVGAFFMDYDVFISPVCTRPALPLGELDANAPDLTASVWLDRMLGQYAAFTPIFNVTGQPAISLPLHHSEAGLPVGVQFAAPHGDEATLFQLAGQLEHAMPWRDRKPSVSI